MKLEDLNRLSERDLIAEMRTVLDGLAGAEGIYNLTAADTTALTADLDAFEAKCDALDAKRAEVATARGERNLARAASNENFRDKLKKARLAVGNHEGKLGVINLDQYDTTPTAPASPDSAPFAQVDVGILRHTLVVRDGAAPENRGRPDGMRGYEVHSKVGGDAPATDADFSMIAFNTKSEHIIDFPMTDKGKQAWYRLRWVTTSGEQGPWGPTAEATVSG